VKQGSGGKKILIWEGGKRRLEYFRRFSRKQKALRYYKGKEEAEGLARDVRKESKKQKARNSIGNICNDGGEGGVWEEKEEKYKHCILK
jgi:hypothetical protein